MKKLEEDFYRGLKGEEIAAAPVEEMTVAPPVATPRPLSQKSVFSHPDAHPVVLDLVLLKHFQIEWFAWLPETIFTEIEQTFGTHIAEINKLKIMAAKTLHVIDAFWDHWEIFEKTIASLNGIPPRLDVMQPPDLPLLFAGVDMANSIRQETYGEEVARYCAAVFLYENVHYAPSPLDFCQVYIDEPIYRCKDCGKIGSALPPFDGLCSSCAGHFDKERTLDFKPDREALDRGFGRNIVLGQERDPSLVKARLEEFESMPAERVGMSIRDVSEDIQAAKLITAIDFKTFRERQLSEQLGSLRGWLETA